MIKAMAVNHGSWGAEMDDWERYIYMLICEELG